MYLVQKTVDSSQTTCRQILPYSNCSLPAYSRSFCLIIFQGHLQSPSESPLNFHILYCFQHSLCVIKPLQTCSSNLSIVLRSLHIFITQLRFLSLTVPLHYLGFPYPRTLTLAPVYFQYLPQLFLLPLQFLSVNTSTPTTTTVLFVLNSFLYFKNLHLS